MGALAFMRGGALKRSEKHRLTRCALALGPTGGVRAATHTRRENQSPRRSQGVQKSTLRHSSIQQLHHVQHFLPRAMNLRARAQLQHAAGIRGNDRLRPRLARRTPSFAPAIPATPPSPSRCKRPPSRSTDPPAPFPPIPRPARRESIVAAPRGLSVRAARWHES